MFRRTLIGLGAVLVVMLAAGAFVAGAFGGEGDSSSSQPDKVPEGMQRVLAPIDEASIERPTIGTEYRLVGTAGLPGGCAQPAGYEINRNGRTIEIEVYIDVPADDRPCTAIYGAYPLTIGLGTDLVTGAEYTVNVNGTLLTFVPDVSVGSK